MSFNLIAILLSLAMMLTGAGGEGQPAEASRTLALRDFSLTINGERVDLDPVVRLGASTDGQSALFEFGVDADGATLLPIQLAADENGLTALFEKSDTAVNISAQALEQLTQSLPVEAMTAQAGAAGGFTAEYFTAYMNMLAALKDEEFMAQAQATATAIANETLDRGEGKPVTEEVEGETRELTEYTYTVESDRLAALSDALLTSNDVFKAYYDAMFGMFANMPEESGLAGVASYAELFEKSGMSMRMDMTEKCTDDNEIDLVDAVLTMDLNEMVARMAESADGEAVPEMSPFVMDIHATKVGENQTMSMEMDYAVDEVGMDMSIRATKSETSMMMDMNMDLSEDGEDIGSVHMDIGSGVAGARSETFTHANLDMDMGAQGRFELSFLGNVTPEGAAEGEIEIGFEAQDNSFELAFVAEITPDAIENRASGHAAALTVDDLSEEGMSALTQDQAALQTLMGIGGSLAADAQKLASNEGIQALSMIMTAPQTAQSDEIGEAGADAADAVEADAADAAMTDAPDDDAVADDEDVDGEYVIDLSDLEFEDGDDVGIELEGMDEDYEEVEDDGVLGFDVPEITWLPEGWTLDATSEDTAYDWADATVKDENGNDGMYALFFADEDDSQTTYVVDDEGGVTPVEGREISVVDFGDEGMSVSWRDGGLYYNLVFYSNAVDMQTIGRIIAGIHS